MRLAELRTLIKNDYLENDIISGQEAKELVNKVVGDGLTSNGVKQLEKLRHEFGDAFSAAGIAAYDKAAAKAIAKREAARPRSDSTSSVIGVQSGLDLSHIDTSLKLSEIPDTTVRAALKRLDVNNDGKVNSKDMTALGLSKEQLQMFIFSARLLGAKIDAAAIDPAALAGKTICFTGVADKAKLQAWAEELGAKVRSTVSKNLDYLVVGDAAVTGKDERALALNQLGQAKISVVTDIAFENAARAGNATGTNPDPIDRAVFEAGVIKHIEDWYADHTEDAYAEEMAEATTPAEKEAIEAKMASDIDNCDIGKTADGDSYAIDDRYWSDDPDILANEAFRTRLGDIVPKANVEEWYASFYPEYAGIGLSKTFFFDNRSGELLEEGEIMD